MRGYAEDTVQQNFNRTKSIHKDLLDGVLLLLIDTDFYLSFFDIGMVPRLELYNSERISQRFYEQIKITISESDLFWGRWIELYDLRYDSEIISNEEKDKRFNQIHQNYKSFKPKEFFSEELNKLAKIDKELHKKIFDKLKIMNDFYRLCFYLSYRSFIMNSYYYRNKEKPIDRINSIKNRIEDSFQSLENKNIKNNNLFYYDYRICELYYKGSTLIGSETKAFIDLSGEERKKMIDKGDFLLKETTPKFDDNLQYRVWYNYYSFLNLQRKAENSLLHNHYMESLELFAKAFTLLQEMEQLIAGGFFRILLKIKYQKRGISYIINSLEAFLLEKQLEDPYNQEFRLNEERHNSRDNIFENIQKWMKNIRNDILSPWL